MPAMIVYQEFSKADCQEVLAFWQAIKGLGLNPLDDTPAAIGVFLDRNPGFSFMARRDGRIVGALLCGHDGRRGAIYHLAVAADCRRMGIGQTLLQLALDRLKEAGIGRCRLLVLKGNEAAEAYYQHLGWEADTFLNTYSKQLSPAD